MKKRVLLLVKLLCLFFVLQINQGCAPKYNVKVLIHMLDAQEKYFKNEVIPPFEKEERARVSVYHYDDLDNIESALAQYGGKVHLIKIPFNKGWTLLDNNVVMPLNGIITQEELKVFNNKYLLTSLGEKEGDQYYVPRKFETRIMVYRKSKVKEALSVWRDHQEEIKKSLKKYNGFGLPSTYILEADPDKWDYFDIYVIGWIWANREYGGIRTGRIAHRGKRYSGTALRLIDRAFQCSAESDDVVEMKSDAVVDAFYWESVYAKEGILNSKMWEESWSGSGVWEGFSQDLVFLSFMTQLDCFFIHGTGRDGLNGYVDSPDDIGFATMPAGCSLELDEQGNVLRKGKKSITTGGWWWGIPSGTPDPLISYKLVKHITNRNNQIEACSRFGMIPVRKEILSDMSMLFGGSWISKMYEVSFHQIMENRNTILPVNTNIEEIQSLYLDAWFEIVAESGWSEDGGLPDREYIKKRLSSEYSVKAKGLVEE